MLEYVQPESVIDVGCGLGAWLAEFSTHGVQEVLGLDGDYVEPSQLLIPPDRFRTVDLSQRLHLDEQADLAVCLEVAEHLTAAPAKSLIQSLTEIAPVVLFSAAVPGQRGTHHVNEQWPDFWAERFNHAGFVAIDCLRDQIWENEDVAWWYAQNIVFFVDRKRLSQHPELVAVGTTTNLRRLVHPRSSQAMWEADCAATRATLIQVTEPGTVIIVDDGTLALDLGSARPVRALVERNGVYWGPPADDSAAIEMVERVRSEGAHYIAFAFPAAWWLNHYASLVSWLRDEFDCIYADNLLTVFDFAPRP